MEDFIAVTGGGGHLGNTIVRQLLERGKRVRALVLTDRDAGALEGLDAQVVRGNVLDPLSLEPFLEPDKDGRTVGGVIHTAGLVAITAKADPLVHQVNVDGTANVLAMCRKYGVKRLVYTSSVHAVPELPQGEIHREVSSFRPELVHGNYAKTKAKATQLVLDANCPALETVVVHPSGLLGPGDYGSAHLTQMVVDCLTGSLRAAVGGGYDFVDVRDVAQGTIAALEKGRPGECYLLSGAYYSVAQVLETLAKVSGCPPVGMVLPMWLAKATAPMAELYYRLLRRPPLYTAYSLYTLETNAAFSHEKADSELGYHARPLEETLRDTVDWLRACGRVPAAR